LLDDISFYTHSRNLFALKGAKNKQQIQKTKRNNEVLSKDFGIVFVVVWLRLATKAPRSLPSSCWGAEENRKKQAETGWSG